MLRPVTCCLVQVSSEQSNRNENSLISKHLQAGKSYEFLLSAPLSSLVLTIFFYVLHLDKVCPKTTVILTSLVIMFFLVFPMVFIYDTETVAFLVYDQAFTE